MPWKSILIQTAVTLVAVLLGLWFFDNSHNHHAGLLETPEMEFLKDHLANIERTCAGRQQDSLGSSNQPSQPANIQEVIQSLRIITDTLSRLEAKIGTADRQKLPVNPFASINKGAPPQRPSIANNPLGWMQGLTEEKRKNVDQIFKEQGNIMRERLPTIPGSDPPNSETLKQIIDENDQELREKLRSVLDEEEYRNFLNSVPKPPNVGSVDSPSSNK